MARRFPFARAAVLLWLCFALHNLEEVLRLPAWLQSEPDLSIRFQALGGGEAAFVLAVVGLTVLLAALLPLIMTRPWLLGLLCWVLLANVLSHIGTSVMSRSLSPGLFSALLLLLPVCVMILRALPLRPTQHGTLALLGTVLMPLVALSAVWGASRVLTP